MRPSHIEYRLEQQLSLMEFIANAVNNLTKVGTANITPQRLETRLDALKEHWEKFNLNHNAIGIAMTVVNPEDKQRLLEHSYFTDNLFAITHESYLEAVEKMSLLKTNCNATLTRTESTHSLSQTSTQPSIFHHARLPRIDLPKFSGTPSDWLPFKDLFNSLVLSNPTLTSVEKLQYLKTSLIGSAAHLLKNTALTADNFQKAWDALISFYENKRLLVNSALHSLVTLKRMSRESASEMEQLYTNIMQIYRTLETLQRPVETWDDFLVFIAVQRLDSESVKAWEHHLGSSKEPPTWSQFSEFLMTRMVSLQAFEKSRNGKPTNHSQQHSAKSHYSGQAKEDHNSKTTSCVVCSGNHLIYTCPEYTNKSTQQKMGIVSKHKLCYNCLGQHLVSDCRSPKRCQKCGKKHHSSIHQTKPSSNSSSSKASISSQSSASLSNSNTHASDSSSKTSNSQNSPSTPNCSEAHVLHSAPAQHSAIPCVFLATARVTVITDHGEKQVRALIDQGSEISLISERLVQLLHLPKHKSSIPLVGIGAQRSGRTKGIVSFKLKPHFHSNTECLVSAHILPKLTSIIPSVRTNEVSWKHLKNLELADPHFHSPGPIDIILGADIYGEIIEDGIIKGAINTPIAQRTKFGWIISGPCGLTPTSTELQSYHVSIDQELHNLLQRFWQLDEIPSSNKPSLSVEEQDCENQFQDSYSRDETGRYIVRLPLKKSTNELGDSRTNALRMIKKLEKRFVTDQRYHQEYSNFLKEYESLDHMKLVPFSEPEPSPVYYLPHHGVIREHSSTTKLRVVFNGSSRTSTGVSLNDILHIGAKHQVDLFDILIWFRQFRYAFSTDIEKMYRQIKIHPADWDLQRILWIDQTQKLLTYQLTTVTYGLACAPFLALRTLVQLITDEGHKYPLAIPSLKKGRYVDDIFGGADTIEQSQEIAHQVNQLCLAGGFPLKKWISNEPLVLQSISTDNKIQSSSLPIDREIEVYTLGLSWRPSVDTLHFATKLPFPVIITKRTVLSTIAKLFDPLGLLSPVTIRAKILMQELWSIKLNWDDCLPEQLADKWTNFVDQLSDLSDLSFPRWLGLISEFPFEIHGFCDASQHAISAAVYYRTTNSAGDVKTTLVCSKTKVAPLKRLTIPRLELSGAVLLTKLVAHVIQILDCKTTFICLWTDSSVVYTWINNNPSRWKEFVHNRVCFIQEKLPQAKWRLVPGKDNPADCATRGLTPRQLSEYTVWWSGPQWLTQSSSFWPSTFQIPTREDSLEERPVQTLIVTHEKSNEVWDLIRRYSTLTRLLRITALCQHYINRLKRKKRNPETVPNLIITTNKMDQAKQFWIKAVQQSSFSQEIQLLLNEKFLPKSSSLVRLTPFLDSSGLLRVGGRLHAALLPTNAKHPFILPKNSPFTQLIIADAHLRTCHGGTQATLALIRNNYWIIGGRAPVRSYILKCVRCTRYRQKRAQQLMGQLPETRITPSRPFLHSGVDYAGPFNLKTWKGRAARTYKAYIALFVCHSTSALHLELVTDYTTEAFLAAYKRFTSRRGICATLTSDCGTNLKGADSELQRLFTSASKELNHLASLLANDGTQWKFIPPGAPHFGGKWEAGVKSVKYHLRRVIGEQTLTYEEMTTLLSQIEAVLNSRPLCPLTDDPDDLTALTPGHFLIGHALCIVPEPSLEEIKLSRLSRWQHIRQMLDSFWSRWCRECLQRYHAIYKWNQPLTSLKEGALVLVIDERYPPAKWPLGRIIQTHPGKDGHTRVVTVRTQTSTLRRPIVKICPLPIESNSL